METLPEIKRGIEELRVIQKLRLKAKMVSKVDIGDGVATLQDSGDNFYRYTGKIVIVCMDGNLHIQVQSNGKMYVLPCDDITCYSIQKNTITFQLGENCIARKCILELYNEEQVEMVKTKIPPIKRPAPETYDDGNITSSDSDSNDSGAGKTSGVNSSFDSDNQSEHE